jgi:uncharacterized protein (DUF2252 family)
VALKPGADLVTATQDYETWLASRTPIVRADLQEKHERMCESPFVFLRATFYWWIQRWPSLGGSLAVRRAVWPSAICTSRTLAPGATPRGA